MRKVAIVTGASRGIGRSIASRLAADGFSVAISYAGNTAAADEVTGAILRNGGKAIAIKGDVGEQADVAALFSETHRTFGQIDVVVNNAAIMPLSHIAKEDMDTFDRVIRTNLRGTYLVFAQAAQHISDGGRVIAFSSSVLAKSFPGYGPYIASKAGVEGLVHVFANELRGRNITVNAVAPGPTGTDLFLNGKSSDQISELSKLAPLERLGTPEDIAALVSFLAGPDGGWINSQIIRSNGGFA